MVDELIKINNCTDKDEKYKLTIAYMESAGIVFKVAQNDHLNHQYRIMENDTSIFVYVDYFKFNLCNADKIKLDGKFGLTFEPLYKNKAQQIRDNVRPWTCNIVGAEMLEKVVCCLAGEAKKVSGINVARLPRGYAENGNVICPNCDDLFTKADRCPECGQLIKYET